MRTNPVARRRGISIAAAALSLALIAPVTPAVVAPQTLAAAQAQEAAPAPVITAAANNIIVADAVANGYVTSGVDASNAANTVSGWAVYASHTYQSSAVPLPEGTKVYMQWIDGDGAVSPIYQTETHNGLPGTQASDGFYAFDLREPWIDANGTSHLYDSAYHNGRMQQVRIWTEPLTNPETGQSLVQIRQAPGGTSRFVPADELPPIGAFNLIGANLQRTGVFMQERYEGDYLAATGDRLVNDTVGYNHFAGPAGMVDKIGREYDNSVSGVVWLETGDGTFGTGPTYGGADRFPSAGYTIWASTLTPEGAAANAAIKALPFEQRAAATKTMLTDHPEYIAKTVYGPVGTNGMYTLRFGDYLDRENMIMWVEDPAGNVVPGYNNFMSLSFGAFNGDVATRPSYNGLVTPNVGLTNELYNVSFALVPSVEISLDITNFDVAENPAGPGDTALIDLNGQISPFVNKIVWTNSAGDVLKTCDNITSLTEGEACTYTVPEDQANNDIITATYYEADDAVAADSFAVHVTNDAAEYQPAYAPLTVPQGQGGTVAAPTFTNAADETVPTPEGTTFAPSAIASNTPEGFTINPDGSITVDQTVAEGQYSIPVVVTYADGTKETAYASVTVGAAAENPKWDDAASDGNLVSIPNAGGAVPEKSTVEVAGSGSAVLNQDGSITVTPNQDVKPGDKIVVTVKDSAGEVLDTVTVTVFNKLDVLLDPSYEEKLVAAGATVESAPVLKNAETGQPIEGVPAGTKFSIDSRFITPEGYTISVDEATGVVKVIAPAELNAETAEEFPVPVDVAYPDGTIDEDVLAKFQLDTDGDGIPDVTDEDDDNDGVSDVVETEAGSNPKDGNSKPVTPAAPDWNDGEAKPGEAVTLPNAGGSVPADVSVGVAGPGAAVIDKDGNLVVTPNQDAKPGDKITVKVVDKDGNTIDTVVVTVTEPVTPAAPDWNDGEVKPGEAVTLPNAGGSVPADVSVGVAGPGAAVIDKDGNLVVTPNQDAKPGDKITVKVVDKDGNTIDTVVVTVAKPDVAPSPDLSSDLSDAEKDRCTAAALGWGIPLLALIPLGLATTVNIPGLAPMTEQARIQMNEANTALQKQLGIFNPQIAKFVNDIDAQLRVYGLNLGTIVGGLAAIAAGIGAATTIGLACTPGAWEGAGSSTGTDAEGSSSAGSSAEGTDPAAGSSSADQA
ncbi:YPDG domain-containing protein [Corynebacterium liangguodongii]|uniref:YPDG domain-containing protein n=1 Tax=Corynebacterium liangguodongii TaxID=2079535 RepID=UPI000D596CDB|nr:YPDG domain-containing protein [Corynebacterium liangguodongii]PWB99712.1 hypothetical protein DF219_05435 [Corynebacterium liangguodongii]